MFRYKIINFITRNYSTLSKIKSTIGPIETIQIQKPDKLKSEIENLYKIFDSKLWYSIKNDEIEALASDLVKNHLNENELKKLESMNNNEDSKMKIYLFKNFPFKGDNYMEKCKLLLLGMSKLLNIEPYTYQHYIESNDYLKGIQVENASDKCRPDWIGMYCLVPDRNCKTILISTEKLFELLPAELREEIRCVGMQKQFKFNPSETSLTTLPTIGTLFYHLSNNNQIGTRYSSLKTYALNNNAYWILLKLRDFFSNTNLDGLELEAGDLIFWYNHSFLNGKTAINESINNSKQNKNLHIKMYFSKRNRI